MARKRKVKARDERAAREGSAIGEIDAQTVRRIPVLVAAGLQVVRASASATDRSWPWAGWRLGFWQAANASASSDAAQAPAEDGVGRVRAPH